MTIVAWDGVTLATDSTVWKSNVAVSDFNKIVKVGDWVFSLAGVYDDYYKLEKQLKDSQELEDIDFEKLSSESEYIIFHKEDKKHYYEGLTRTKITEPTAIGASEEYALALLQIGHNAKSAVQQSIRYHSGAGGKVRTLNIGEYFGWNSSNEQ